MSSNRLKDATAEIPNELLLSIFRYLRRDHLTNVVLVSNKWHDLGSEMLWKEISTLEANMELQAREDLLQLVKKATFIVPSPPLPQMPYLTEISLKPQRNFTGTFVDTIASLRVYPLRHLTILSERRSDRPWNESDVSLMSLETLQELTIETPNNLISFEIPKLKRLTLRGGHFDLSTFFSKCKISHAPQDLAIHFRTEPLLNFGQPQLRNVMKIWSDQIAKHAPLVREKIYLHLDNAVIESPLAFAWPIDVIQPPLAITWLNDVVVSVTGSARSLPSRDIETVEEINLGTLFFPSYHRIEDTSRVYTEPKNWQSGPVPLPLPDSEPEDELAFIKLQDLHGVKVDYQVLGKNRLAVRIFVSPLIRDIVEDLLRRSRLLLREPLDLGPEVLYYNPQRREIFEDSQIMMHEYDGVKYVREWTGIPAVRMETCGEWQARQGQ